MKKIQFKIFPFWNRFAGFLVFCISFLNYFSTMERGVSWWDCGELIASAYKLEVCHPPGAPFFLLIERLFAALASSPYNVAICTNLFSALVGAGTIMFLFWSVTFILKKVFCTNSATRPIQIAIIGAGLTGSMLFAFSDSFWASSTETEVYSFSAFFTAVTFWAALQWTAEANKSYANRWLVFIALLLGISTGVHFLNLLMIPVIALTIYFHRDNISFKGFLIALIIGCLILTIVLKILIPGIPALTFGLELFFVNILHLPFHSGTLLFLLLIGVSFILLIIKTHKRHPLVNLIITCLAVFLIGCSSYFMVLIRSSANPPINEFRPDNMSRLVGYLNRDQYDAAPLFYGSVYSMPSVQYKHTGYFWERNGTNYSHQGTSGNHEIYTSGNGYLFPRMYSNDTHHIKAYQEWGGTSGSFLCNFRFFFKYQLNFMYFRYLMWNFSGRQNDIQGNGNAFDGNWITGFNKLDAYRLNSSPKTTTFYQDHTFQSQLFLLPFILGIIGIVFSASKPVLRKKIFPGLLLFFLITGPAIAIYLNQTPYQARERDYVYMGSFYVFALWTGLGAFALIYQALIFTKRSIVLSGIFSLLLLCIPALMFEENYSGHNRSKRSIVHDMAMDYLDSCAPNAILFTAGDNDTFPLWYAQEVEGFRTDVRVCNVSLLTADWYINQMRYSINKTKSLKMGLLPEQYYSGKRTYIKVTNQQATPIDLKTALDFISREDPASMISYNGIKKYYLPSLAVSIKIPENKKNSVSNQSSSAIFPFTKTWINKSDLAVLDILQHNWGNHPIYFDKGAIHSIHFDIGTYLRPEGFTFRLVPTQGISPALGGLGNINTNILYQNLMNRFHWRNLNLSTPLDYTSKQEILASGITHSFCLLAEKLYNEGQVQKAREVLMKACGVFFNSEDPDNYIGTQLADACFYCKDQKQAVALIKNLSQDYSRKLAILSGAKKSATPQTNELKKEQLFLFHQLLRICQSYQQTDLTHQLEQLLIALPK